MDLSGHRRDTFLVAGNRKGGTGRECSGVTWCTVRNSFLSFGNILNS